MPDPSVLSGPLAPPAGPPSPAPAPLSPGRGFGDLDHLRTSIYDSVFDAASKFEPVANATHTLKLTNPRWIDPPHVSLAERKKAILRNETLGRRMRGDWHLIDNATGQPIATRSSIVATIPKLTDGGTFVRDGVEYTLANQFRLLPGVYTRQRSSGEIESHVNVMPGKGVSHRYTLDPAKSQFKIEVGQSSVPLLPLLRAMGTTDSQLREVWGDKLLAANSKEDARAIPKLYERMLTAADRQAHADPAQAVAAAVAKIPLDPDVTARTLGRPHATLSPDAILDATRNLLAVYRGEREPDDRDAMVYQRVMGPEDLMAERIRAGRKTARTVLWKATARKNLASIPTGFFDQHTNSLFQGSGLANAVEETNPLEMVGQWGRVTRLGEGGISGGADAIPQESREVNASHLGFVDPILTPESGKVGVDLRLAGLARKGPDGQLLTRVRNTQTGQYEWKTARELADSPLAFPNEMSDPARKVVRAVVNGNIRQVPRHTAAYEVPHMEEAFSTLANLIPGKSTVKGQRAVMGARMLTQALAMEGAEAPLVQSKVPDSDESYSEKYGVHAGALRAKVHGRVLSVGSDSMTVKGHDGQVHEVELANNLPYNRKSLYHHTPMVQVGQDVKPGDLLAKSNYTDDQGRIALGKNLYTAYIPDGNNFEDAITYSASAARKMKSEHLYQHSIDFEDHVKRHKRGFAALFPNAYSRAHLAALDDDGIIKPGTVIEHGQPLVLGASLKPRTHNRVLRGGADAYSNSTQEWEHHAPGVVTDVEKTDKGVVVAVKSYNEMKEADKTSGLYGDKGLVKIVPDEHMPTDSSGRPFEVLLNPLGVQTRGNPMQAYETVLGKIAKKTGTPYKLADFPTTGKMNEFVENEMKKHDVSDTDTVVDPRTGVKIPGVLTGYRHMLKLHHMAEDKNQGRGLGAYSADEQPARGSGDGGGSKRFSVWDTWAMLSHGAVEGIRDAKLVRGQKNPDYWAMYQAGHRPPEPDVPFVHKKFVAQLQSAGINPTRTGTRTRLLGMTDKNVQELTEGRELKSADTVNWGDQMKPVPGGLFDPVMTGEHGGNRWAGITLHEPMLNPVFEEPARRLLGLTKNKFRDVIAGKEELNGKTGPGGLAAALQAIDVPSEMKKAEAAFRSGKKTYRDDAVKKWAILKAADRHGVHPKDWVLKTVPVMPPVFRPVSMMQGSDRPMVADPNFLYKELFDANKNLKDLSAHSEDVGHERLSVYDAFKGVVGLGDPVDPKNQERGVKGVLKTVFGSSPKYGVMNRKLLSTTVDTVGRSVIVPNADLDMDQVGLPENKAWDVFKPFVVRRLARQGVNPLRAGELVQNRDPIAHRALQAEMSERPVQVTRAPILHRYGTMAFRPVLVKGDSLHLPPVVYKGFGADNDGDQVNYHVPVSDAAVTEALQKMLPSKNLLNVRGFGVHQLPQNEFVAGLYEATHRESDRPAIPFESAEAVIRALRSGAISHDQKVLIRS